MKKFNNLSMIFGILFAIGLGVIAYLSFILAIVLSFVGVDWFAAMMFVFAALVIVTLVGASLARKKVVVTIVTDIISLVAVLFVTIYLLVMGILADSLAMTAVFLSVFVLGLLSLIFGILSKKKQIKKEVIEVSEQV